MKGTNQLMMEVYELVKAKPYLAREVISIATAALIDSDKSPGTDEHKDIVPYLKPHANNKKSEVNILAHS